MRIIAFAASSSQSSINKQLATYAASLVENADVDVLDLNDYELPLFSEDREKALKDKGLGQPQLALDFLAKMAGADAIIISFAEHNGNYSAAYKNLFDWCTRIDRKVYQDKPVVLLSTSPGGRGGASVLQIALNSIGFFGADVKASLSVPSFHDNFADGQLTNPDLDAQLREAVASLN